MLIDKKSQTNLNIVQYDEFEDIFEMLDYCEKPLPSALRAEHSKRAKQSGFNDFDSYAECVSMIKQGWKIGREILCENSNALIGCGKASSRFIPTYDVSGAVVDVARYLEGIPEDMLTFQETIQRGKTLLSMGVNISWSSFVDSRYSYWRGAAVLNLVDALEANGVRVQLHAVELVNGNKDTKGEAYEFIGTKLKNYEDALNIDTLAFPLCAADYLRRIGFAVKERIPSHKIYRQIVCAGMWGKSYGGIVRDDSVNKPVLDALRKTFDVYYHTADAPETFRNKETTQRWVSAELKRIALILGKDLL